MSETTGRGAAATEPEAEATLRRENRDVEITQPSPETEPETTEPESDDLAAVRREAAGYRRKLRDAEAERDALREQVDRRDRADAERLAAATMESGADMWTLGVELTQLRDEEGTLSPELVEAAVGQVLAERPHWRRRGATMDGGARTTAPLDDKPSFGEALKAGQ